MGLLLALTPCGLCHASSMSQSSTCSMAHMGNMKCCQNHKSHSLLCQVMDQSTLSPSIAQVPVPVSAVGLAKVFHPLLIVAVPQLLVVPAYETPPRSSPILRI
jgi:hypothetical protein